MNVVEALAGQLAAQRNLISDATLQQVLERCRGGGSLGRSLVAQGLVSADVLRGLLEDAARGQVLCAACGWTGGQRDLNAAQPLTCPRCQGSVIVAAPGKGDTRPDSRGGAAPWQDGNVTPGSDRFPEAQTHTGSARANQQPGGVASTQGGSSHFNRATTGSARFAADGSGTMRFRAALAEPGGTVGPFELLEELGRGGMGVVYKARHVERDELVAMKVLIAGGFASERQQKRFHREITTLTRLDHPNIVPIRDAGHLGDHLYFTMALIDGRSAGELIRRGRLSTHRAVEIARDVALGLQHAHERGVIHRDVKPDNILVEPGGRALLTDFGLVRDLDDHERLTRSGALLGTPYYMSPEQARGKRDLVGPPTDLYGLGAVLYQMLTGEVPFKAKTQIELMQAITLKAPVKPRQHDPEVPVELERLVLRCLEKDPEDRYPTAQDLADDLDAFLGGGDVRAGPAGGPKTSARAFVVGALATVFLLVGGGVAVREGLAHRNARLEREREEADARARAAEAERQRTLAHERLTEAERAVAEAPPGAGYRQALTGLLRALSEASKHEPEDALLVLRRGRVHERLHLYREALGDYTAAMELDRKGAVGAQALLAWSWLRKRSDSGATEEIAAVLEQRLADLEPTPPRDLCRALLTTFRAEQAEEVRGALARVVTARRDHPEDLSAWSLEAMLSLMLDDGESALHAAERGLSLDPRDPLLLATLGIVLSSQRRMDEALEAITRALEIDPELAEALSVRGSIRARQGDFSGAATDLERSLSGWNSLATTLELARVHRMAKRPERSDAVLARAEDQFPTEPDVYSLRTCLQLERSDLDGAVATLRRGVTRVSDPLAKARLHRRLLDLAADAGRFEALGEYAEALRAADDTDPRAYEVKAEVEARAGRLTEAVQLLEQATRFDPRYEPARELSLRLRFELGLPPAQVRAAVGRFLTELADDPRALCYGVHYELVFNEDLDAANDLADRATQLAPGSSRAWETHALVSAMSNRLERAATSAQRAVRLDEYNAEAHRILSEVYLKMRRKEQAAAALAQTLWVNPFSPQALERLPALLLQEQMFAKAIAFCEHTLGLFRAAKRKPPAILPIYLVNALASGERTEDARSLLERIMTTAGPPPNPEHRRYLALALAQLGRKGEAKLMLEGVVNDDPTNTEARKFLELLKANEPPGGG